MRIMTVPKHVIVAKLRERGKDTRADWVDRNLPDEVDLYNNRSLLATLDLRDEDLIEQDSKS
jgi:hypothetical protein